MESRCQSFDETRAVRGIKPAGDIHADQIFVVKTVGGASAAAHNVCFVQPHVDLASHWPLCMRQGVAEELEFWRKPVSVVDKVASLLRQRVSKALNLAIDAEELWRRKQKQYVVEC